MSLERDLLDLLIDTAVVYAWTGDNAYNQPTWAATGTTHPCRIDRQQRMVTKRDGMQGVSTSVVYLGPSSTGGYPGLTVQSRLVLSDGTIPDLLMIEQNNDEDGTMYYEAAHCG